MLSKAEFLALFERRGGLVIDGALATELEARGQDLKHALWSAKVLQENPRVIQDIHKDYYMAGADIAITASYQASTAGLRDHLGLNDGTAGDLIQQSVHLAQLARSEAHKAGVSPKRSLLVAGSIGPYGAYLSDGSEYRGDYVRTLSEYVEFHEGRMRALIEANVDLLAIETIPSIDEVRAVVHMLKHRFPGTVAYVSCTLRDSAHLADGTPVSELVDAIVMSIDQIVAIGFNCVTPDVTIEALGMLRARLLEDERLADVKLLCYPNSGELWNAQSKTWAGKASPDQTLSSWFGRLRGSGCALIGGCCRTTPKDIREIAGAFGSEIQDYQGRVKSQAVKAVALLTGLQSSATG